MCWVLYYPDGHLALERILDQLWTSSAGPVLFWRRPSIMSSETIIINNSGSNVVIVVLPKKYDKLPFLVTCHHENTPI